MTETRFTPRNGITVYIEKVALLLTERTADESLTVTVRSRDKISLTRIALGSMGCLVHSAYDNDADHEHPSLVYIYHDVVVMDRLVNPPADFDFRSRVWRHPPGFVTFRALAQYPPIDFDGGMP